MSRSIVLPLAARRELLAVRVAADIRYARVAALFDQAGGKLDFMPADLVALTRWTVTLGKARRGDTPKVSNVPAAQPKVPRAHRTSVSPVGDKFLATCSCGDTVMARPTGESYAKGMATKHVRAVSVPVDAV